MGLWGASRKVLREVGSNKKKLGGRCKGEKDAKIEERRR